MKTIEGLRERTEYIDIFLFFRPSLNRVLFPMFCLLVEGECQILVPFSTVRRNTAPTAPTTPTAPAEKLLQEKPKLTAATP